MELCESRLSPFCSTRQNDRYSNSAAVSVRCLFLLTRLWTVFSQSSSKRMRAHVCTCGRPAVTLALSCGVLAARCSARRPSHTVEATWETVPLLYTARPAARHLWEGARVRQQRRFMRPGCGAMSRRHGRRERAQTCCSSLTAHAPRTRWPSWPTPRGRWQARATRRPRPASPPTVVRSLPRSARRRQWDGHGAPGAPGVSTPFRPLGLATARGVAVAIRPHGSHVPTTSPTGARVVRPISRSSSGRRLVVLRGPVAQSSRPMFRGHFARTLGAVLRLCGASEPYTALWSVLWLRCWRRRTGTQGCPACCDRSRFCAVTARPRSKPLQPLSALAAAAVRASTAALSAPLRHVVPKILTSSMPFGLVCVPFGPVAVQTLHLSASMS